MPHAARHARGLTTSMLLVCAAQAAWSAQTFQAEGADTGAGLGPRYVAQGGVGVANSDDVYAIFYNPAGLAAAQGFELSVSRQLNAQLHPINFLGAAWRLPIDEQRWGVQATVAAAYYPRIHARASGAFGEGDFESLFLRYLLPGISGTFDGDIDTKTKSYRAALGVAPVGNGRWSLGAYLERIDCKSTFCGVHAQSNGFTTQSTGAKALGVGLGVRYRATPQWTWAASISDVHTRLNVESVTTDAAGTRVKTTEAQFPRKISVAAAWQAAPNLALAADFERTQGRYGSSEMDLQVLRVGAERRTGFWAWRGGAMVPVKIYSSMSGTLHAPFPVSPTIGLGWRQGALQIDMALYAHAVMSMHKDGISPAADLSLSIHF